MSEGVTKPVKITISGKIQFVEDVTVAQAAQIIALLDLDAPIQAQPLTSTGGRTPPGRAATGSPSNPRDSIDSSGAKTNPEKIVAFALHVLQDGGKDTVTIDDIKPLFRRAREVAPGNLSRDLNAAIKAGWVAETDNPGEFYVTDKAARVLDDGFDSLRSGRGNGARTRSGGIKKPRKGPAATPEVFTNIAEVPATRDGYLNYHKLKTKKDKLLWALSLAKMMGIESLTNQEAVWLTDRLGDGITGADMNSHYKLAQKPGFVNRSTQDHKMRITPQGEEHLQSMVVD